MSIYRDRCEELEAENEELSIDLSLEKEAHKSDLEKLEQYRKSLLEIKKLCKIHTDFCKENKKKCDLCPHEPCEDIIILQTIKEVL